MASVKNLGNGKFKVTISLGFGANGKRQRTCKVIKAKDMEKAKAKAAVLENKYKEEGHKKPTKLSFDDVFEKYLAAHQGERQLSIKTEARYRQMNSLRIKDFFSQYKLEQITALTIDKFFTDLRQAKRLDGKEGTLSELTIKHHWRLLYSVFKWAFEKDILAKNPMLKADKIYVDAKEPEAYDEEQIEKLCNALDVAPLKYKVATYLTLDSGIRSGELVGLTKDCVDFENSTININKSVQYISEIGKSITEEEMLAKYPNTPPKLLKRRIVVTPPKTKKSTRIIFISSFVMDMLAEYMNEQESLMAEMGNKWENSPWIFTDSYGDLLNPNMISKWFNGFLKINNLPALRFHGLRHTSASLLIAKGQDIAAVSERLGHSDKNTTWRTYIHSSNAMDKKSASIMDDLFSQQKE